MMDSNLTQARSTTRATETAPRNRPLGQLLVAMGALDQSQLAKVLEIQRAQRPGDRKPLGRICIEQGYLSHERLNSILDRWSKRLRLGELLVNRGYVNPQQLEAALERQRQSDKRVGELLIDMGVIDEKILTETLAEQYDIPYVPMQDLDLSAGLARFVNAYYALRHGVVPIGRIGRRLTVAIQDPTDGSLISDLEHSTGMQIQAVMTTPTEIHAVWKRLYENGGDPGGVVPANDDPQTLGVGPTADLLVQRLVGRAVSVGATEIRFDSRGDEGTIAIRLDDSLRPMSDTDSLCRQVPILIRTLLISARLDPNETYQPQIGYAIVQADSDSSSRATRLKLEVDPGATRCSLSARIDGGPDDRLSVGLIGPGGGVHAHMMSLLRQAKGVFLIVGPTGSGKRGVLRRILESLHAPDRSVCSIEEPLLGRFDSIRQHGIDSSQGEVYSDLLDRVLSSDPDVIGLERIADQDAAKQIFSIGRQGPLIVSTLRASNSTSAIARLLGLGVGPAPIASSLTGVLAIRLLRRNCPECGESYEPRRPIVDEWFLGAAPFARWRRGVGCDNCHGTGFSGTFPITELWIPTADQLNVIGPEFDESGFRELVLVTTRCLGQDAIQHVIEGRSTLEEALKLVPYQDVVYTRLHGLQLEKNGRSRFVAR